MPPAVFTGPGTLFLGELAAAQPFSCDLTDSQLSDVSPVYSAVTGCGTVSKMGPADLQLAVAVVQDVENATSLHSHSWEHHNEVEDFVFVPNRNQAALADISETVPGFRGRLLVTRLPVGAGATALASAQGTWKVEGDVERITAPPVAA